MFQSISPTRSLSSKIIIVFLLSAVIPMIIMTLINNNTSHKNVIETARLRIQARVEASTDRIESYLDERRSDATVIGMLPSNYEFLLNPKNKEAQSRMEAVISIVKTSYNYDDISIVDNTGKILLSTRPNLEGNNIGGRDEIQQALLGFTAISDFSFDPSEGEGNFHVTAPVHQHSENTIIGAVDFHVSIEQLDKIMAFDTDRTGQGSYGVLMDRNLIRISVPSNPKNIYRPTIPLEPALAKELIDTQRYGSNTEELVNNPTNLTDVAAAAQRVDEGEDLVFFRGLTANTDEMSESLIDKIEGKDWYYLHRVPEASFLAVANQQSINALLIMGAAAFLSVVSVIAFSRQMLNRPLTYLVEVAKAIAEGDLNRRLDMKRQDEIGTLAKTFNTMADGLQTRIVTEQQAQEEARRLQEIETQNRQNLENTIRQYLGLVQKVAEGNLNQQVTIQQDGMLGELGIGLNTMIENLRTITQQVQQASANIASASTEILSATTQQASSATEQSSAITEATTTVDEVKSISQQTAHQATQLAQDSQSTLEMSRMGTTKVEESLTGMSQIRQRVESIAQTILALSEQTQAIGAITSTVSELADQSNMLALNAAIEAARAGEQGKSFAVVAQQVRELAERSKAATGQVQEILGEIQRATNAAVMVTEEGTKGVEEGVRLSSEAGQVIHQIASEVESGAQSNTQMAAAAQQQTTGMEQIGVAMKSIQQATTQTLASTRQAERAARDLNELAQSLQEAIDVYQL